MTGKHPRPKPRAAAIAAGARTYFTGKRCKHGHLSERDTLGHCMGCIKSDNPRRMRSRRSPTGCVYVISSPNGYVKIGKATNAYDRFSTHQTSSPLPLTLYYVCECSSPVDIEEEAHNVLNDCRRHCEWFEVSAVVAMEIVRSLIKANGFDLVLQPPRIDKRLKNQELSRLLRAAHISEIAIIAN